MENYIFVQCFLMLNFYFSWKYKKILWFSDAFRRNKNETLARYGLKFSFDKFHVDISNQISIYWNFNSQDVLLPYGFFLDLIGKNVIESNGNIIFMRNLLNASI